MFVALKLMITRLAITKDSHSCSFLSREKKKCGILSLTIFCLRKVKYQAHKNES